MKLTMRVILPPLPPQWMPESANRIKRMQLSDRMSVDIEIDGSCVDLTNRRRSENLRARFKLSWKREVG